MGNLDQNNIQEKNLRRKIFFEKLGKVRFILIFSFLVVGILGTAVSTVIDLLFREPFRLENLFKEFAGNLTGGIFLGWVLWEVIQIQIRKVEEK